MARFAVSDRTSAVPTAVRGPSVYAAAANGGFWVKEVGVFNTTATQCCVALAIASATGTQGAGLTEVCLDDPTKDAADTAGNGFNTHTADATVGSPVRQASLGAAIGSGVIWTFGENGLFIPEGTANGLVIIAAEGVTGQHVDFYFEWSE